MRVAEETNAWRIRRNRGEARRERAEEDVFLAELLRVVDTFFLGAAFAVRGDEADREPAARVFGLVFGVGWGFGWESDWGLDWPLDCVPAVCALNPPTQVPNNTPASRIFLRKCPTATRHRLLPKMP